MAYIKKTNTNTPWLLIGYRPTKGAPERFWRCPDKATFRKFEAIEAAHRKAGTEIPDPATLPTLRQVPSKVAAKEQAEFERAQRRAERAAAAVRPYTVEEWIGRPIDGAPGPMFEYTLPMNDTTRHAYQRFYLPLLGALAKKPLQEVKSADARALVRSWLVCPACATRAMELGRSDLLKERATKLVVTAAPFDEACVDENGDSTHYPAHQRSSMEQFLQKLRAIWNAAKRAAEADEDPRVADVAKNPWRYTKLPQFADRTDNNDLLEALTPLQLEAWAKRHPTELEALVWVGAYGLLRRSELLGMSRDSIEWPTRAEQHEQVTLTIRRVLVKEPGRGEVLRPWGKTEKSSEWVVQLPAFASEKLREHMTLHRSTPNATVCDACRGGLGEHTGPSATNPHTKCDFANDAPVWCDPKSGKRLRLDSYTLSIAPKAARLAGLTKEKLGFTVSPKVLRATGATLMLELGVADHEVARIGRWTNTETLREHYYRSRSQRHVEIAAQLDRATRVQLGVELPDGAHVEEVLLFTQRRVEALETEVEQLRAELAAQGGELKRVERRRPVWEDVERIALVLDSAPHMAAALRGLGLSIGTPNYRRLEQVAREHNLELPPKWNRAAS